MIENVLDWNEAELRAFLATQTPEGLSLDYKGARTVGASDAGADALSRVVVSFANAIGGLILLGVEERKDGQPRYVIDLGVDRVLMPTERLGQLIDGNVRPRVPGLQIHSIGVGPQDDRCVYAILVPPAQAGAVHQARNHVFYRRYTDRCQPMEQFEVAQAFSRQAVPDIRINLNAPEYEDAELAQYHTLDKVYRPSRLVLDIENVSPEPAMNALVTLYVDSRLRIRTFGELERGPDNVYNYQGLRWPVKAFGKHFNGYSNVPLFNDLPHAVLGPNAQIAIPRTYDNTIPDPRFFIASEVLAPRMAKRRLVVFICLNGSRVTTEQYGLSRR